MYPNPCTQFLHNLQGHLDGTHFLISVLKCFKWDIFLSLSGTIFQMSGPKYLKEFSPL